MTFVPIKVRSCLKQRWFVVEEIWGFLEVRNIEVVVFPAIAVVFLPPS